MLDVALHGGPLLRSHPKGDTYTRRVSVAFRLFTAPRSIYSTEAFHSVFWLSLTGWKSRHFLDFFDYSLGDLIISYFSTFTLFASCA